MRSATLSRCISTAAGIAVATLVVNASSARRAPDVALEPIAINDNRVVAGTRDGDRATIHLEARQGEWHPEGETDDSLIVRAFAEEGGPLRIPGPLIRVLEGTRIRVVIRNRLDRPIAVHGLYMRPASGDGADAPLIVPAGDARDIEFGAGAPGTYFYWAASDPTVALSVRDAADSQLSGGLIVDPRGTSTPDRVLLITSWNEFRTVGDDRVSVVRFLINGKTWPHTERLAYDVGDTVRIRVLNVGLAVHPMHLHGFYFRVDSRGAEGADTTFPPGSSPHLVNTERLPSGRTFSLTWTPTRPGNWLFHCHDTSHTARTTLLDGRPVPPPPDHHAINHALEMMTGPIIGITVRPAQMTPTAPEAVSRRARRVIARADSGGTDAEPAFGFALEERGTITPAGAPYLPGPTIILKTGEPVSVTIENRLPEPTAVHWHGIELESYYDGVAGFAGSADRLAPAIPAGGTFEARFTPPRSGTFIYHSHINELRQQQAGLTGALLVVDSPETYDASHNLVLLITVPRHTEDGDRVFINGTFSPAAREIRVGDRYRLRFINIHTYRPSMRMRVVRDGQTLNWRALAKDGMDLPADQATVGPSEVQMGNGETYDFEFMPAEAGEAQIEVRTGAGDLLAVMPLHIRAR